MPGAQPNRGVRMFAGVPLWRQVGVVLCVATIITSMLSLQNLAGRKVVLDSFRQLEQEAAYRSLDQVLNAFQADLDHVAISVRDHAWWTTSARSGARSRSPSLNPAFASESLDNMGIHVVWMLDTNDREILSIVPGARGSVADRSADPALIAVLRHHVARIKALRGNGKPLDRLLQTPRGLMAFASHEIHADGKALRGTLLFGRFVDAKNSRERARSPASSVPPFCARHPAAAERGCSDVVSG